MEKLIPGTHQEIGSSVGVLLTGKLILEKGDKVGDKGLNHVLPVDGLLLIEVQLGNQILAVLEKVDVSKGVGATKDHLLVQIVMENLGIGVNSLRVAVTAHGVAAEPDTIFLLIHKTDDTSHC